MSSLAYDAEILRKRSGGGVPAVGRNSPFAHVADALAVGPSGADSRSVKRGGEA